MKVEPCFTFEQCCDTIIKAYHDGDVAPYMNSTIEDFLIPYYTKYKKEFLMSKRNPIRELVQRLFRNAVAGKSITDNDIVRTLQEINGVASIGLHPELKSWNEMTPEEQEEMRTMKHSVLMGGNNNV